MSSLFSSIFNSLKEFSAGSVVPSSELAKRTTPASRVNPDIANPTPHRRHQNNNINIELLISEMTKEIQISENIIEKDESKITDPKQLIKLQKCKETLNKLIQSLQNKIQAIQTHSITINNEIIDFLNESLQNVIIINNICNKIYANENVQTHS